MEIPTIKHEVLSKVHLIGGEKGGVGKSMVSRLLAQYFIDQQIPFLGFDTDRSHGPLMRFYADYASSALVDRYEALDAIIEAAVKVWNAGKVAAMSWTCTSAVANAVPKAGATGGSTNES